MGGFLFLWAFFGAFVGLCEAEFLGVWCKFGAANLGFGFSLLYMGKFFGANSSLRGVENAEAIHTWKSCGIWGLGVNLGRKFLRSA